MSQVVHLAFQGRDVDFTEDGWFSATVAAAVFGKNPAEWLRLPDTIRYIEGLGRKYGEIPYLKTTRGRNGGTWLHPKLAVRFARWLDVDFEIWCDEKIDALVRGNGDHKRARHSAASSHKVMCGVLQAVRLNEGKGTIWKHYANESKLMNWSLGGEFKGLDRDGLTVEELDRLAQLEIQNAVMIGSGVPYTERKGALAQIRELPQPGRQLPVRQPRKKLGNAA